MRLTHRLGHSPLGQILLARHDGRAAAAPRLFVPHVARRIRAHGGPLPIAVRLLFPNIARAILGLILLYLGRIDNRVEDFNIRRAEPTRFDLREALDAVLAGKPVTNSRTKAFGCAINPVK